MSANNWARCPRCQKALDGTVHTLTQRVADTYGKIPAAEFADLQTRLVDAAARAKNGAHTFREDYEITGAKDGLVKVGYSGGCSVCGLTFSFEDEHEIPGVNE